MFKRALRSLGLYLLSLDNDDGPVAPKTVLKPKKFDQEARRLIEERRREGKKLTAGSIQLVGLDEAKQALGKAWPKIAERATGIAERIIRRHLTTDDICTKHGDGTFVICFVSVNEVQAARTARHISQEIKSALVREAPDVAGRIEIENYVTEIESDYIVDDGRPLPEVLLGSLAWMRAEAEKAVRERRAKLIREARVLFRPVWHPRKSTIQLYRCMLDGNTGGAAMEHFGAISEADELKEAIAELDYLVFSRVLEGLHALVQRQATALFLVPVHFQTLANKTSREDYFKLLQNIPPAYKKFILCEIYSVPAGTPVIRLREIVGALRTRCSAVVVQVESHKDVQALSEASAWGMSIDVGSPDVEQSDLNAQRLKRCVNLAHSQRLLAIAHGANSAGQLLSAIDVGFDLINGEAVHQSLEEPKGAFTFTPPTGGRDVAQLRSKDQ